VQQARWRAKIMDSIERIHYWANFTLFNWPMLGALTEAVSAVAMTA
jgi:hypothetical protein